MTVLVWRWNFEWDNNLRIVLLFTMQDNNFSSNKLWQLIKLFILRIMCIYSAKYTIFHFSILDTCTIFNVASKQKQKQRKKRKACQKIHSSTFGLIFSLNGAKECEQIRVHHANQKRQMRNAKMIQKWYKNDAYKDTKG